MDLFKIRMRESTVVDLIHPQTHTLTGVKITVCSRHFDPVKSFLDRIHDQSRNTRATKSAAETNAEFIRLLVAATLSWEGLEENGEQIPCTPEKAKELYSRPDLAWIRGQVDAAIWSDDLYFREA